MSPLRSLPPLAGQGVFMVRGLRVLCLVLALVGGGPALAQGARDGAWLRMPGTAADISINADGQAYVVSPGGTPWRWDKVEQRWRRMSGRFVRIAAAEGNRPWAVDADGVVFHYNGLWWEDKDKGVGDVAADTNGNVYIAKTNGEIKKWYPLSSEWRPFEGSAKRIALDAVGQPWVVAADGANSWVRQQAGIGFLLEDYRHVGVVANFETEKPHRGAAWQWFRKDGVLAYLPLPGNRISMVWSTPPEHAAELQALAPEDLARRVTDAGRQALGELRCVTPAAGFPLKRRLADEWVRPGLVLLGDTAHTVHPLAGQGVNLGFHDSRLLAEVLKSGGDPGEIGRLTAYAARRREDVVSMQFTTGGLRKLFGREILSTPGSGKASEPPPEGAKSFLGRPDERLEGLIRTLRNQGMNFTDHFSPLSQALMHHAVL